MGYPTLLQEFYVISVRYQQNCNKTLWDSEESLKSEIINKIPLDFMKFNRISWGLTRVLSNTSGISVGISVEL